MQTLQTNSLLQGGRYRIINILGQGGFGITYLAIQSGLERKVAIKEFFMKELCERDKSTSHVTIGTEGSRESVNRFREKFLKEARTLANMVHPNIVRVIDVFEENGTAYYVMDYVEGESLSELVKRSGALSEDAALNYISQVANALSYIHDKSINHLDIKPANIMVRQSDSTAVLIDFGLSKQYDTTGGQTSSTPIGISDGYAPLEQYQAGGVRIFTPQTDIYSLGATLFYLVTGSVPPSASEVLNNGIPALPSHISISTKNAIHQAMQFRKNDRPQSVTAFVSLLNGTSTSSQGTFTGRSSNADDEATKVIGMSNLDRQQEEDKRKREAERKAAEEKSRKEAEEKVAREKREREETERKRREREAEEDRIREIKQAANRKVWMAAIVAFIAIVGLVVVMKLNGGKTGSNLHAIVEEGLVEKSEDIQPSSNSPIEYQEPNKHDILMETARSYGNQMVNAILHNDLPRYRALLSNLDKTFENVSEEEFKEADAIISEIFKKRGITDSDLFEFIEQEDVDEAPPIVDTEDDQTIFQVVEEQPEFPGGMSALMQFLSKSIKYPTISQENGVQGRVIVQFVVNRDGSIVDPVVARSVDPYLDKEAIRVVTSMPKWKPGKQRGKAVRCRFTLPVAFKLQ